MSSSTVIHGKNHLVSMLVIGTGKLARERIGVAVDSMGSVCRVAHGGWRGMRLTSRRTGLRDCEKEVTGTGETA